MRSVKILLGTVLLVFAFQIAPKYSVAASFPWQEHLETVGLKVSSGSPEEAALLLNLPQVYILPDSPLYFLKKLWEGAQIIMTAKPEERGELLLSLAEKRLAEGVALLKKGDWNKAAVTLQNYQGQFENAQSMLAIINDLKEHEALRQLISHHLENQKLLAVFLEKIGASSTLSGFKPRMPTGQLELRPINTRLK